MRHNYPSSEARERITRELARLSEELDELERELHALWRMRSEEPPETFGEEPSEGTSGK